MKEIIIVCVLVISFFVVAYLISNLIIKQKKVEKKESEKPSDEKVEQPKEKEDDIPEILKEVTMGNYLYDDAKLNETEQLQESMVENTNIEKEPEKVFRVELGEPLEEMFDDEPLTTRDILEDLDNQSEESFADENTDQEDTTTEHEGEEIEKEVENVAKEIKKLSPKMKAILIANLLNKKDKE